MKKSFFSKLLVSALVVLLLPLSASGLIIMGGATDSFAPYALVTTNAATNLASTSVTLNGTAYNYASAGTYYFNYGTSIAYTSQTTPAAFAGNTVATSFSTSATGLTGAITYHYQACVTNGAGVACGGDVTFVSGLALQSSVSAGILPHGIAKSGNFVYIANASTGVNATLRIIDVTSPTAPVLKSATATGSNTPERIQAVGTMVYLTCFTGNTFQIWDATVSTAPIVRSSTGIASGPYGLFVSGSYAYITVNGAATFKIYDITVPTAPVLKSTTATNANPYDIFQSGVYTYVTNTGVGGFQIYDSTVVTGPTLLSTTATGGNPTSIRVVGNTAYVIIQGSPFTLQVWNVTNKSAPSLLGSVVGVPGVGQTIAVDGNFVYSAHITNNSIKVFDVTTSTNPFLVSINATSPETSPYWIVVSGSYAYLTLSGTSFFQVWKIN